MVHILRILHTLVLLALQSGVVSSLGMAVESICSANVASSRVRHGLIG